MTPGEPRPWGPAATLPTLHLRAAMLARVRDFFRERALLEVETPLLCRGTVTDPALSPIACPCEGGEPRHLQTSPEVAMKRLLAAGSGDIYQISRAFRGGEQGRHHNPEFTLIEWYRVGWSLDELLAETHALLAALLGPHLPPGSPERLSYDAAFAPLGLPGPVAETGSAELASLARRRIPAAPDLGTDTDAWRDLLFSHLIQPALGRGQLAVVTDYPPSQALMARLHGIPPRAARAELFFEGIELGNGFEEETRADVLAARFAEDQRRRAAGGRPPLAPDEALLAALQAGLPACSGMALGFDRLVMLAARLPSVGESLTFDWPRA